MRNDRFTVACCTKSTPGSLAQRLGCTWESEQRKRERDRAKVETKSAREPHSQVVRCCLVTYYHVLNAKNVWNYISWQINIKTNRHIDVFLVTNVNEIERYLPSKLDFLEKPQKTYSLRLFPLSIVADFFKIHWIVFLTSRYESRRFSKTSGS